MTNENDSPPSPPDPEARGNPPFLRKWWVAFRPFALPASTMPVVFGTVLAVTIGGARFDLPLFLVAFVSMGVLHTGANLLNDVYDFRKGIDRQVNPVSGAVVRGWITPREGLVAAGLLLALGSLLGIWIVWRVGPVILWLGAAGVAIGVVYTWGPLALKYNALGDLAVFLNFGVLGSLGAWTVQTGSLSWIPAVWAVPMAMLVSAILHSNNWRDLGSDAEGGIRTMAGLFGDRGSELYYAFLLFGPFAFVLLYVLGSRIAGFEPRMPWTFLVTWLALPLAWKLLARARRRHASSPPPVEFLALDGSTAQLNLLFGLLCTAALGLHALVGG